MKRKLLGIKGYLMKHYRGEKMKPTQQSPIKRNLYYASHDSRGRDNFNKLQAWVDSNIDPVTKERRYTMNQAFRMAINYFVEDFLDKCNVEQLKGGK